MANRYPEIYIVKPLAATNLVTNPSFEIATTSYTVFGSASSIARSATYQRRGAYCLDITPTTSENSGVYFGTVSLTSGTTYTFSADVKDVAGQSFSLFFANTSSVAVSGYTTWTGDGYWKRKSITWTCDSTTTYRLILLRSSVASTTHFYTDGWQCEAGSEASTYFDGDMVGFNRLRQDYGWNGTAHASTSWRTSKTRSGGTLLRVRDYAAIGGMIGFGMPPMINNSLPSSSGGAFYQNTRSMPREVTVVMDFRKAGGISDIMAARSAIVDAIKPDNVPTDEPIVMRFEWEDSSGVTQGDPLDLHCVYSGGLEYDATNPVSAQVLDRAAVTFTAHDPMFHSVGSGGADLTVGTSVSDAARLLYRTAAGQWTSAGSVNNSTYDLKQSPDGKIYAIGSFTSIGGVSANRIAYWDGSAWNAMGSGLSAYGEALAIAPDGYPYVGFRGTTANGVTVNYVAKWTGSTFSALSATAGTNGEVYALDIDDSGNLYVGGNFTTAGGTTVNYIAKWDGTTWSAMDSGLGGYVTSIKHIGSKVYASTDTGSGADVYEWDGSAWTNTDCDFTYGRYLDVSSGGVLYVGGSEQIAGIDYLAVSRHTGGGWQSVIPYTTSPAVSSAKPISGKNLMYIAGSYNSIAGISVTGAAVEFANETIRPVDITMGGSDQVRTILEARNGELWMGGTWTTTPITSPTVNSVNNGSSKAYPVIHLTGPGTFWQIKNYTTGAAIYFNGLTLQAGEKAVIDLRPGRVRMVSDWRGNLMKYVSRGSDLDLFLVSGSNNISMYIADSTAATKALMSFENRYWSIDGAAR